MTNSKNRERRKRKELVKQIIRHKLNNTPFEFNKHNKVKPKKIHQRFFNASYEEYKLREHY